jgi:hypothetical protein
MEHGPVNLSAIAWFAGWLLAVLILFFASLRLPLQTRLTPRKSLLLNAAVVIAALAVTVFANIGLILHDVHIDLTREKVFTPSQQAMKVVDNRRRHNRCVRSQRRIRMDSGRQRPIAESPRGKTVIGGADHEHVGSGARHGTR